MRLVGGVLLLAMLGLAGGSAPAPRGFHAGLSSLGDQAGRPSRRDLRRARTGTNNPMAGQRYLILSPSRSAGFKPSTTNGRRGAASNSGLNAGMTGARASRPTNSRHQLAAKRWWTTVVQGQSQTNRNIRRRRLGTNVRPHLSARGAAFGRDAVRQGGPARRRRHSKEQCQFVPEGIPAASRAKRTGASEIPEWRTEYVRPLTAASIHLTITTTSKYKVETETLSRAQEFKASEVWSLVERLIRR